VLILLCSYWLGSQATGQPIYQYRLILPFDDKMVNVATDMDFNIEGEVKCPVSSSLAAKAAFVVGDQAKSLALTVEHNDEASAAQFVYSKAAENTLSMSYMQAITPYLTLGGQGVYQLKTKTLQTSFGGIFNRFDNQVACMWDNELRMTYTRKVNPNRVHLTTDLAIDEQGQSQVRKGGSLHIWMVLDFELRKLTVSFVSVDE
jgi:hypothetical protein